MLGCPWCSCLGCTWSTLLLVRKLMLYSQRMSSLAWGSSFALLLLQPQWFGNFLCCSVFHDFCSIHFLATCIKSLSIFLDANHNPLDGGRLRVLSCFLGFYLIQNWRLQCFRYGMLLFHIYYMRLQQNASNFSLHAVSQLWICTTTYHMDLRQ